MAMNFEAIACFDQRKIAKQSQQDRTFWNIETVSAPPSVHDHRSQGLVKKDPLLRVLQLIQGFHTNKQRTQVSSSMLRLTYHTQM